MQVSRVEGPGGTTYDVRGLTVDEAAMVAALADFPQWSRQPKQVAVFCAALHGAVQPELPEGVYGLADAHGMTNSTTVED